MDVLKSKRFVTMIVGLIISIIVVLVPALAEHAELLITAIVILVGVLIGGYTAEDIAALTQGHAWKYAVGDKKE